MKTIFFILLLLSVLVIPFESTAQIRERVTIEPKAAPGTAPDSKFVSIQVEWTGYDPVNIVIDGYSYPFRRGQIQVLQLRTESTLGLYVELQDRILYAKEFLRIDPSGGKLVIAIEKNNAVFTFTKPSETEQIISEIFPNMIAIQGGTFWMGCSSEQEGDCEDNERPAHQVTLSDFSIGKYEVTQEQWRAVMGTSPSYFKNCETCPVEGVSWNDIQTFLRELNVWTGKNYRLPTEAEWEYAARGGNKSKGYKYSGSNRVGKVGWYRNNSGEKTRPVGQKKPNELGIYDMTGNVLEWCQDWYGEYDSIIRTNPSGPSSGSMRLNRGGRWRSIATNTRVSIRYGNSPWRMFSDVGFRLAL
jgi:formylglycine-generating enzyme required for sulfatase activity